ncbi:MAG: hypothetical protein ACREXY_04915 [Gammaproteobacteria bacterium]
MSLFFFLGDFDAFPSVDWTEFLPVRESLDPADWTGRQFELRVIGFTSNASYPLYARLYNATDLSEVTGSAFLATIATAKAQCRSSPFDLPTGEKNYAVQYGGTPAGATLTLYDARLKVLE